MKVIDKIVTEWAFRCKKGYPDMNNPDDIKILKEIYSQYGIVMEEDKPKEGESPTTEVAKDANIEAMLDIFEVSPEDKKRALQSELLRSANSIENFSRDINKYMNEFGYLFKYGKRPYGKGELIPFMSINGAKLGASKEKDITVGGKVLEVKALDSGKYFDTASEGSIAGTSFLQNVEMFFRYLSKFDTDGKYKDRIEYFNQQFSRGGLSNGELKELVKVAKNIQISSKEYHYVKIGDSRYAIDPGHKYTLEFNEEGKLVTDIPLAEDFKIFQAKLAKHPWVTSNGEQIIEDLNQIQQNYLKDIDYLLLYRKGEAVLLNKEQAKKELVPYRISFGNLHVELLK